MIQSIEKHSIKISLGVAAVVIVFLINLSMNFTSWQVNMEAEQKELDTRVTHVGEKIVGMRSDINVLIERANDRDIQLATINTKLGNIEALLLEIKQDLK